MRMVALEEAEELWPGMARNSVVVQLDVIFVALTLLTLLHAASRRGFVKGSVLVAYLFTHTLAFEHASLFLGGTHCHATSSYLPAVSPCSSLNSILFYVPWTYTSVEAGARLLSSPSASGGGRLSAGTAAASFPLVVGLLQAGFGAPYEMQGPVNGFWNWPGDDGVIARSEVVLAPWAGYPRLPFLRDARGRGDVGTVDASGAFLASSHARDALRQRVHGFPAFAPYFHFAFGFAWGTGLLLLAPFGSSGGGGGRGPALFPPVIPLWKMAVAGFLVPVLFLPPIRITRYASDAAGVPYSVGVLASLGLSLLPVVLALLRRRAPGIEAGTAAASSGDPLLFSISLAMQAFFASYPLRAASATPPGLVLLVSAASAMHLLAQYRCCFGVAASRPRRSKDA